jgi:hypothetical protein
VPGGGLLGTWGTESGTAAPLVGGPPGIQLHTVIDELPSGTTGEIVPVVLPTSAVGIVPNGVDVVTAESAVIAVLPIVDVETDGVGTAGTVMEGAGRGGTDGGCGAGMVVPKYVDINDVAGWADSVRYCGLVLSVVGAGEIGGTIAAGETEGVVPIVTGIADVDASGTAGVPGAICPVGTEQLSTVPGVVGSEANGTGASVVPGVPGWVVAENGPGPLSGDVTIVAGVDERPMAVVPMVDTCAGQASQLASRITVVNSQRRIAPSSASI